MTSGQQDRSEPQERALGSKRRSGSLIAHPAFAPLLGLWGAALGGLTVTVLPAQLVASVTQRMAIATLGVPVQPLIAGFAALFVGGILFGAAMAVGRRTRRRSGTPSVVELAARGVRTINPARDLGSRSLDEPIGAMPFAAAPDDAAPVGASPAHSVPRAMDLAEFGELPGRNAVWVEEPCAAERLEEASRHSSPEQLASITPLRPAAPPVAEPGTAALARLRAVPPSELSMAEMVERFAGALHEHRNNPPARGVTAADLAAREAALAEALKALALLGSGSLATANAEGRDAEESLRAALSGLKAARNSGRGAA